MSSESRKWQAVVVDDDPCVTEIVEAYLAHDFAAGMDLVAFNDAWRAHDWLDRHNCDVLISDIEMPGCNGLEMLRFAKQRNPWTAVIFMTAHSTWNHISEAVENGASDYLLKPIVQAELQQVVRHECSRLMRWRSAVVGTLRPVMQRY